MKSYFHKTILVATVVMISAMFYNPSELSAHGTHKEPIADSYNNYIMSDADFVAQGTMSQEQIQVFLNSKVSTCDTNGTGLIYDAAYGDTVTRKVYSERRDVYTPFTCLKDYTEGGKTAAQIIYETAQSVGINPQVILATLQKEQSLVTDTWPWPVQYQKATGMGCPEGAECNSIYYGFTNQVLRGSQLLKAVYNKSCNPIGPLYNFTFFNTYAGTNRTLDGKSTYVGNCATAAFYQYTPHRPDSAYLTATDGSHYYGNYNLISNLKIWFNITNGKLPVYRFYNMKNGTHFYTANEAEKINVINKYPLTYRYEAVVFVLDNTTGKNTVPLYRFYNMKNGSHFYTANEDEKNNVIARWPGTFKFEGPVYSVAVDSVGTMPVYRFWNIKGTHFYTANEDEKNNVIAKWPGTFKYEGIGYYYAY